MPVGYITYLDTGAIQLTDEVPSMVYESPQQNGQYPEIKFFEPDDRIFIYGPTKTYPFRSIENVPYKDPKFGREIYNSAGKLMYSTGHINMLYERDVSINKDSANYTFIGQAGRVYGYYILNRQITILYRRIRSYRDPITFDDVWEWDEYHVYIDVFFTPNGLRTETKEYFKWVNSDVDYPNQPAGNNLSFSFIIVDITELAG